MSLLSLLFAPGEQERGDRLDAQREELNRQKIASGEWAAAQYEQAQINSGKSRVDVDKELSSAFSEGWDEGKRNIEKTFWGTVKNFLASIPSFVWMAVIIFLFVHFGGFRWAKRKLS